ncbi:MAG: DUF2147 domain-containing protein [Bacteroidales bacterium]|nr:DUF2147 domain-containing protein [Bacteroidales bacterium]
MKQFFIALTLLMACISPSIAQSNLNNKADNIIGEYKGEQEGDHFKVRITKLDNGTYQGQIFWMENSTDANGKKMLDIHNPDRSLRNTPCDQIVLFSGLEYNAKKHRWDGAKIYDPQRGIRVRMTAEFTDKGQLKIRGTVLGIGESVYWDKL